MSLFTESCTLHMRGEQTGFDDYGNPVFGPPQDVEISCWVEPAGTSEVIESNQLTFSYVLYLPLDTQISAVDSITWDGTEYMIDGKPLKQPGGFVVDGFLRVNLKKVTG